MPYKIEKMAMLIMKFRNSMSHLFIFCFLIARSIGVMQSEYMAQTMRMVKNILALMFDGWLS